MSLTNLWRRQPGLIVASLFGVGNLVLALVLGVPQPFAVGAVSFALVAAGARLTGLWVRRVPARPKKTVVLFVHGFQSPDQVWEPFEQLIRTDPDLGAVELDRFQYDTALLRQNPTLHIPSVDAITRRLCTRFEELERHYDSVVIVSHSVGGLVTQRFLARMLDEGQGERLPRIRRVVMFACPTSGAEFLATSHELVPVPPDQEERLQMLNPRIANLQQRILSDVVNAERAGPETCPIPVRLYAGDVDRIVPAESAFAIYPNACTGMVAGDHSTIVAPDSHRHESYRVLKNDLEIALESPTAAAGHA